MTKSTAMDNHSIYIEIEAGLGLSYVPAQFNLPDMCWLAPLVVQAFTLRCQMLGETGEFPQPDLIADYNRVIDYIAECLMPLPLKAMEIARQVATDSIWCDIADAVAVHYTGDNWYDYD
ncbi:MAG: hypothetical protein FWE57_07405 [Chitinispirillia bacterium]|nr:hypothetical protein [Chitinispirillia bacterium]